MPKIKGRSETLRPTTLIIFTSNFTPPPFPQIPSSSGGILQYLNHTPQNCVCFYPIDIFNWRPKPLSIILNKVVSIISLRPFSILEI